MIAHGDRHSVAMPINLLAALGAFASTDDMRPSMRGVLVKNTELVACDGLRLVRVDMIHDAFDDSHIGGYSGGFLESPYLIPLRAITACVAAAKAIHAKRVRVWREALTIGKPIRLEVSTYTDIAFVMETRSTDLDYPPIDQLMNAGPLPTDKPPEIIFNPRLLADVAPVLDALGISPARGLKITGWGDAIAPMHFEATGVRFIMMPMKGD